jgi:hypothetical protein
MIYKNLSFTTKTFYGVTFKPGEEHEVPGYINHPKFLRLTAFSAKHDDQKNPEKDTKSESSKKTTTSSKTATKKEVNLDGANNNQ